MLPSANTKNLGVICHLILLLHTKFDTCSRDMIAAHKFKMCHVMPTSPPPLGWFVITH